MREAEKRIAWRQHDHEGPREIVRRLANFIGPRLPSKAAGADTGLDRRRRLTVMRALPSHKTGDSSATPEVRTSYEPQSDAATGHMLASALRA